MAAELQGPEVRLTTAHYEVIVGHCFDGLPDEACGLLAGPMAGPSESSVPTGEIRAVYPCRNAEESSRIYTVDTKDHLGAERDAEDHGMDIVGVMHSHTHTNAYPSPTDVAQAVDPNWHYVIVSLKDEAPVLRSYRIVDGEIREEPVGLQD